MEQENEEYIIYKINTKNFYKVYTQNKNGRDYFKVLIQQKEYDGTKTNYYKQISFKKGLTPPKNEDMIRIKKGIENLYVNSIDKYNPISNILVLDYELKRDEEKVKEDAYNEFSQNLAERENGNEITIDDSQLPF